MSRTIHLPKRDSARARFCRRSVRFRVRALGFGLPVRWVAEQVWRWCTDFGLTPGQASAAADYARRYAMRRERAHDATTRSLHRADALDTFEAVRRG